jgi:hypothetical protein
LAQANPSLDEIWSVLLLSTIVLIGINPLTQPILLPINLPLLRGRKLPAIERALSANLFIHGSFLIFKMSRLARCQLAGLHALRDTILLIFLALPDPASCLRGKSRGDKHARDCDGNKKPIHDFAPYEGSYFNGAFIRLNQYPRPEVAVRVDELD